MMHTKQTSRTICRIYSSFYLRLIYKQFLFLLSILLCTATVAFAQVNFTPSKLLGTTLYQPTSLQFGPDGKLYVAMQNGLIHRLTIQRNGSSFQVTQTEVIDLIQKIKNHNDDGSLNLAVNTRQVTGILVTGSAVNPKVYVTSSDPRIGGAGSEKNTPNGDGDMQLDTNSGILSLLTFDGTIWSKTDLVRGLSRSEENHAQNGLALDPSTNSLFIASGGMTNAGSPSVNFAMITEYALSGCVLKVDLNAIALLPIMGNGNEKYVYDLPTLDDPTRSNQNGKDIDDPFGGNDGRNQAKWVTGGPVQVFSPGYRNLYDMVWTTTPGKEGRLYGLDNGANQGWGGYPDKEGTPQVTNQYVSGEPGSLGPGLNDAQVNNQDNLHLIYKTGMNPIYGGHPNPVRANPGGAGLFWKDGTGNHFSLTPTPDWPPVPLTAANLVEGDFRNPGINDGALTTFFSSTNGITEYKASGFFGGQLTGDLLAASFDGTIKRIKCSNDGASVVSSTILATGFASIPLDLTTQGDNDIFPGTIWVADYQGSSIYILDPVVANATATWSTVTPANTIYPEKRGESGFVEANGKMYLLGGSGVKPVNIFNPATQTWSTGAPIPNNLALHHFQAVSIQEKIYIINAFTGYYPNEKPVPDIYVYNTLTNAWTVELNAIPLNRRRGSCAAVVYNGNIYLIGGITNGHNNGTVNWTDVYDPAAKTWSSLANAPHLRDHVQAAVINGKIYLAGGRRTNASTNNLFSDLESSVDVYDISANQWSTLPASCNLPLLRADATVVNLGGKCYLIGGESTQGMAHQEVHALDPATGTWTTQPKLITGRHATQATVWNGKIFIAGGYYTQGGNINYELNGMEVYSSGQTLCTGDKTSLVLDDDGDGYSNKDEADNGTDPCSAASKPNDNDGDLISDKLDTDDDNDLIPDTQDVFHLDATNGKKLTAPFLYPFLNGDPATGIFGLGFTGLMGNGTDPGNLFQPQAEGLIMGGAVGLATLPAQSGTPELNTLTQGFQWGMLITATSPITTIESELVFPFFGGITIGNLKNEYHGIQIGTGTQEDYIMVAITPNFGNPGILVLQENGNVPIQQFYPLPNILNGNVKLFLEIDPVKGTVQPRYKMVSDTAAIAVGPVIQLSGKLLQTLQGPDAIALGIIASARNGNPFPATWDYMKAIANEPVVLKTTRINVGGGMLNIGGTTWEADNGFSNTDPTSPSNTYSTANAITGTTSGPIYQSERFGKGFIYQIPVTNGPVTVRLHFAEIYWNQAGQRIFHVNVENGQGKLDNFDILSQTAPLTALVIEFPVQVTDGMATITFTAVKDMAKVAAIEVLEGASTPPPPPPPPINTDSVLFRINCGGPSLSTTTPVWNADNWSGTEFTSVYSSISTINNTSLPVLYQSERYGINFGYALPVANGSYTVKLHFAELYWNAPNMRIFNINVENAQGVLNNFDIYSQAGKNTAIIKSFNVNVTDGILNIGFSTVLDNAKISAIEVIKTSTTLLTNETFSINQVPEHSEHTAAIALKVAPNPSKSSFTLHIEGMNGRPGTLRVIGAAGQLMDYRYWTDVPPIWEIGGTYPPGIYQVEVIQADRKFTTRIIKQ